MYDCLRKIMAGQLIIKPVCFDTNTVNFVFPKLFTKLLPAHSKTLAHTTCFTNTSNLFIAFSCNQ